MLYSIFYGLARAAAALIWRVRIEGRENIPQDAALICANHTSLVDPVLIAFALGKKERPAFMAKAELFSKRIFGAALKKIGAFPVKRGKNDISAIRNSLSALKSGKKLIIFPEGTRVSEGEKAEAHTGAGMLAVRTGCPVVPVYISPKKRVFSRVRVVVGEPFLPDAGVSGREAYRIAADEMMARIASAGEAEDNG